MTSYLFKKSIFSSTSVYWGGWKKPGWTENWSAIRKTIFVIFFKHGNYNRIWINYCKFANILLSLILQKRIQKKEFISLNLCVFFVCFVFLCVYCRLHNSKTVWHVHSRVWKGMDWWLYRYQKLRGTMSSYLFSQRHIIQPKTKTVQWKIVKR